MSPRTDGTGLVPRDPVAAMHGRIDLAMRDAILAMRPKLGRKARGRAIFDDVQKGRSCWRQLTHAMETAAAGGATLEELLQISNTLGAYARWLAQQRRGDRDFVRPMSVALLDEYRVGQTADYAQVELLAGDTSPTKLQEVIATSTAHMRRLTEVVRICYDTLVHGGRDVA